MARVGAGRRRELLAVDPVLVATLRDRRRPSRTGRSASSPGAPRRAAGGGRPVNCHTAPYREGAVVDRSFNSPKRWQGTAPASADRRHPSRRSGSSRHPDLAPHAVGTARPTCRYREVAATYPQTTLYRRAPWGTGGPEQSLQAPGQAPYAAGSPLLPSRHQPRPSGCHQSRRPTHLPPMDELCPERFRSSRSLWSHRTRW